MTLDACWGQGEESETHGSTMQLWPIWTRESGLDAETLVGEVQKQQVFRNCAGEGREV